MAYDLVVAGGGPSGAAAAVTAAKRGLKVALVESGEHSRPKPCGGLVPNLVAETVRELFGDGIPDDVSCSPRDLGLFYSPPSGPGNGGVMRNYRLLNLRRASFDKWLRSRAEAVGVEMFYGSSVAGFEVGNPIECLIKDPNGSSKIYSSYLIGADGVFSAVKRKLTGRPPKTMGVIQETWSKASDVNDLFYIFLDGHLSSTYAYLIPKGECVEVGLGAESDGLEKLGFFRTDLRKALGIKLSGMIKRVGWAIPGESPFTGKGKVLLVGDAAGFCNPLSGEGIRLGIDSGEAAGAAVADVFDKGGDVQSLYSGYVKQIEGLVTSVREYIEGFTNTDRESFVASELRRVTSA